MTAAATSEFSAASGTTEKPQHWLDQVTLEGEEKTALIEEVLKYVQGNYTDGPCNREDSTDEQTNALESAARKVENKVVIWLMHQQLFGDENKNTLPEFLKSGISLDLRDEDTGQTLLMTECSRPRRENSTVEETRASRVYYTIVNLGVQTNPRLQDHNGETASTLAAQNGRVEMLDALAPLGGNGNGIRNATGESPLRLLFDHFMSADPQNLAEKPNSDTLWEIIFGLITHHDFAGMPKTGPESFEKISRTLQLLVSRSLQGINQEYGVAYLNSLIYFAHKNDQYQQSKIAQLEAQLAAAEEKLGRTEVPALLLPPSPQS